jgi:hypothetical protein
MKKSKLFFIILISFIAILGISLYWFENQEASPEENEYLPLPDSLVQQLKTKDSTEEANFLNTVPPDMKSIFKENIIFEQKKDAYTFQILSDSLGLKIVALFGTKVIGETRDKSIQKLVKAETSDLNSDGLPEILVFHRLENKLTFIGYEAQGGLRKFVLPPLMGRQSFGYAGRDTLFVENNNLIRRFQFRNAQFGTIPSGTRSCEYTLGPNLNFSMVRTLDTE